MQRLLIVLASAIPVLAGCSGFSGAPFSSDSSGVRAGVARSDRDAVSQVSFRVRSDIAADLSSSEGWAGALNENVTIQADQPFRVRFEVEGSDASAASRQFRLQYRRNGGRWMDTAAQDFPHPEGDDPATSLVSIVSCAAFSNGAATTDVLNGSMKGFTAGSGVTLAERTPRWASRGAHGEFEWALVARRFADGAVTNEQSDTIELRMVESDGTPLRSYRTPILRFAIPSGHVGGTFVETPGRIGPFRATNGDLYFIMEPTESDNIFMVVKSTDNGVTWREVDGANRPETNDLESVDAHMVGDTIHILHQVTRSSHYHAFHTSEHPLHPDTWAVRDQRVASERSIAQAASLVVRSDGSMVAFYIGETLRYSIRSPQGVWSGSTVVDAGSDDLILVGPRAALGRDDTVHVAYYRTDGTIWYRSLFSDGTLTGAKQLASGLGTTRSEYGAVMPLVFIPQTDSVVIMYRLASGELWERRVVNDGEPATPRRVTDRRVVQNAVDSQQPGADVVLDGTTLHVLFIEESSGSIYSTHDRDGWSDSELRVDGINGQWVRGNVFTRSDGARVYGYVYDAGSNGGTGMNRFAEFVLSSPIVVPRL